MSDSSDASFELLEGPPPRKKKPSSLPASRKRARRSYESNPEPKYKEDSSESEFSGVSAFSASDSDDAGVVLVDSDDDNDKKPAAKRQKSSISSNAKPPRSTNGVTKPIPVKKAAVKSPGAAGKPKMKAAAKPCEIRNREGIDVVIPHALLNKHKAPAKNECTLLVQMNDDTLDLHGQSGAVGRLEADERGVILDLKGYQYRGTIRPGPTAMVVALTREGQFKVESITDEFVTLDAQGAHVMDSMGDNMREGFMVREEDVNARNKGGDEEGDEGGNGKGKMGKKRAAGKSTGASAPKKRKKVKK